MSSLLALLIALFPALPSHSSTPASLRGTADEQRATITLTVHVLPTSYGTDVPPAENYPKTIQVNDAVSFSGRIAAYGLANRVFIAPKDWTGSAAVGADGSTLVTLFPVNGSTKSGPRFRYENEGGCAGCALDAAAPYFPNAMREWKKWNGSLGPADKLPRRLKLIPISSTLTLYSSPDADSLFGRGAACFAPSEPSFAKAEFFLAEGDAKLLNWLVNTVVSRQRWK